MLPVSHAHSLWPSFLAMRLFVGVNIQSLVHCVNSPWGRLHQKSSQLKSSIIRCPPRFVLPIQGKLRDSFPITYKSTHESAREAALAPNPAYDVCDKRKTVSSNLIWRSSNSTNLNREGSKMFWRVMHGEAGQNNQWLRVMSFTGDDSDSASPILHTQA